MVEVVNFGCRLNSYESEAIKDLSSKHLEENVVIFNTCAVTKEAERQARQAIRKARILNPGKKIIVTGCAAQINPGQFESMDEVDKVVGNHEKMHAETYQNLMASEEKIIVNDIMMIKETAAHLVSSFEGKSRVFLQVQNGCNHRCTFCTIPYGRGNSRSVPIPQIIEQTNLYLKSDCQEIVLTGVDITDYGLDLPGKPTLASMIRRLLNLTPLKRLRLSSIDVAEIDDELFDLITQDERIMPHIHLSLQAGDDMILKRMKRRHRRAQILEFCENVRKKRPDVIFGADIITGFPTETDEMFNNTVDLIREAKISMLHVFPYSERDNTPASRMPQVDKQIRKKRAGYLREVGQEVLREEMMKLVGQKLNILLEKEDYGKTDSFIPVRVENVDSQINDIGKIIQVDVKYINDKLELVSQI